jgi:hypothetical protein
LEIKFGSKINNNKGKDRLIAARKKRRKSRKKEKEKENIFYLAWDIVGHFDFVNFIEIKLNTFYYLKFTPSFPYFQHCYDKNN